MEVNGMKNGNGAFAGKTMLLVNTGSIKKRFILQKLKKLGLKIVVLNKEKNWANEYVDSWILADTANHAESLQQVEKFIKDNRHIHIDGALTFWEDDVLLTSKITDKFNFIGIPFSVAKKARNKYLFRKFCEENGIKAPKNMLIKSARDLSCAADNFAFPVVLKPTYGSSSAFVVKAENKEEFYSTYEYIKKNISSKVESALSEGLDILVEEYIDGDEVDIDILLQNGKIKFWSITDNYKTREPFFVETGQAIPSSLPKKNQGELLELAELTLEKLGVQNGCVHFEAKISHTGPAPIEVNLRMGGDEVNSFVKGAWHVDLIEYAAKISLGIYFNKIKKKEEPYEYLSGAYFLPDSSGILIKFDIAEKIKLNKNLEEFHLYKKIGDAVLVPPEGFEYIGWLTVAGENPLDAKDNLDDILKDIKFEVAKFDPDSSIGKTLRKSRFSMASMNKELLQGAAKIERFRRISIKNQRNLHIGIAGNIFQEETGAIEAELSAIGRDVESALNERGYKTTFFDFNNLAKTFAELKDSNVDLVFNVCESINNSSLLKPHAAAIFDLLQIPYTGSNPFTLGLCIDKIRVKKLLSYHGIPTPKWDYAYSINDEIDSGLKYPLIVKPANNDSSIGITNDSVVTNEKELRAQLEKVIVGLGSPALVEEYIDGDEYDVPIIGSEEDDLRVLPLSRSIFDKLPENYWHIYSFEAKWTDNPAYKSIIMEEPSKSSNKKLESLITEIALDTYNILDCHDYGRVEIKVDKHDNPYILELNPNPHINFKNRLPQVAKLAGMDYGDFLEEIIRMTVKRYKNKPNYYHLQTGLM